jgi:hypothetical protein
MAQAAYIYELRCGEEIVATGHLAQDSRFEIGDRVTVAGRAGLVHTIIPIRGRTEQRLVVQLLPTAEIL